MEVLSERGGGAARPLGGGERATESTHGDGLRREIGDVSAAAEQERESEASMAAIVG